MKDAIEKVVDLVTFLDTRIAQQVEHQLTERLAQERKLWRNILVDVIAEERARWGTLLQKTLDSMVELTHESNEKFLGRINESVEQMFDRVEARMCGLDDDAPPPPSKH